MPLPTAMVRRAGGLRCVLRYHTGAGGTLRQRRPAKDRALHRRTRALAAEYKARNGRGSMICKETSGPEKNPRGSPIASPRTPEYYKSALPELCRIAADIMAELHRGAPK